jgi:hypothetical protein
MSKGSVGSELIRCLQRRGAKVTTLSSQGLVLCDLTHDDSLNEIFFNELDGMQDGDVDPYVQPHFGLPSPRISQETISEVISVLSTYSCLADKAFFTGVLPPIIKFQKPYPDIIGFNYPHAQLIIAAAVERLQNPGPSCRNISRLPIGSFICKLEVSFTNAIFHIVVIRRP